MIRFAICDDEDFALELLSRRLEELLKKEEEGEETTVEEKEKGGEAEAEEKEKGGGGKEKGRERGSGEGYTIRTFSSGTALRNEILEGASFDVILLDIHLPDVNGIFLARHIRPFIRESLLVFVSSQDEAVYDSFTASPFRFLRKSRLDTELPLLVRDIRKELEKREEEGILLPLHQGQVMVLPQRVMYIEANRKTQVLHLTDRLLEVPCRLKDLEPLFRPHGFIRPHHSYLVNYRFVSILGKTDLRLDNGELLPISRHHLAPCREEYLTLIAKG